MTFSWRLKECLCAFARTAQEISREGAQFSQRRKVRKGTPKSIETSVGFQPKRWLIHLESVILITEFAQKTSPQ